MREFLVEITMNKLSFTIEANNDEEAMDMALDRAYEASLHDLLDGAIVKAYDD